MYFNQEIDEPAAGATEEMDNLVTSGPVTVKEGFSVAPPRQREAVCPLNALLQSQQPRVNSLSPVCKNLCSVCWLSVRLPAMHHSKLNAAVGLKHCLLCFVLSIFFLLVIISKAVWAELYRKKNCPTHFRESNSKHCVFMLIRRISPLKKHALTEKHF